MVGDEASRMLKYQNANALYMTRKGGPGTLIFNPNATRLEVTEELVHLGQHRTLGFPQATDALQIKIELEAQDILLKVARRNNWLAEEINVILRNKKTWQKLAEELK